LSEQNKDILAFSAGSFGGHWKSFKICWSLDQLKLSGTKSLIMVFKPQQNTLFEIKNMSQNEFLLLLLLKNILVLFTEKNTSKYTASKIFSFIKTIFSKNKINFRKLC